MFLKKGILLYYLSRGKSSSLSYDKLIKQDNKQNLKPGLAISWKPIDDLTWEFKLRRDVKFHDGSPFTAEDVKFTLELVQMCPTARPPSHAT
jgi:ABC-type transport system substrate-binding protein